MFTFACLLFVLLLVNSREYLPTERTAVWQTKNINDGPSYAQPEQIHLSYGGDPSRMYVTWLTFNDTLSSEIEYGDGKLDKHVTGRCSLFVDHTAKDTSGRFIHRALLTALVPGTNYRYRVGSQYGWSSIFEFKALKPRPGQGYVMASFGDLGSENARSLGKLQKLAQDGDIDMVLHIGDFAYNMDEQSGRVGDQFLRQLEPVAAYVPYMTAVGNHEAHSNFTHYVNRFTMPNSDHNLYYSFDLDVAHYIVFSTEFYFYTDFGWDQINTQWQWLMDDLIKANANREKVPWIITMGHRPMYCSDFDGDDCTKYESIIRTGLPKTHAYGLEKLFYEYGVDLELWAHEHSYERLWPTYNRYVYNTSKFAYVDPPAPVHVISGSAGCRENTDIFVEKPDVWSAVRSSDYGFGILHVANRTHMNVKQIAAAADEIVDDFWIIKNRHGYKKSDLHRIKHHGHRISKEFCHHKSNCSHHRTHRKIHKKTSL